VKQKDRFCGGDGFCRIWGAPREGSCAFRGSTGGVTNLEVWGIKWIMGVGLGSHTGGRGSLEGTRAVGGKTGRLPHRLEQRSSKGGQYSRRESAACPGGLEGIGN